MTEPGPAVTISHARINPNWVKALGLAGGIAAFILVHHLQIADVSPQGLGMLATMAAAVILWITSALPMTVTCLVTIVVPWIFGYVRWDVALSGFATPTFWIAFVALGLGSGVSASGFSRRLAYWMLSLVGRPTYRRVLLACFVTLFVTSLLIPSGTANAAAGLVAFSSIVPLFGVPLKSRIGMSVSISICMLAWAGKSLTPAGSSTAIVAYGTFVQWLGRAQFLPWVVTNLLPTVLFFIGMYGFVIWYARPEANEAPGGRHKIRRDFEALPAMSRSERWVVVVTLAVLVGWSLDPILKFGIVTVGLIGVLLMLAPAAGVMALDVFLKQAIPWKALIMIGTLLGLGNMMSATRADDLLVNVFMPIFSLVGHSTGLPLAIAVMNLFTYPLFLTLPSMPVTVSLVAKAAIAVGVDPLVGVLMLVDLVPLSLFWAYAPFVGLALKDDASRLKDWILMGVAYSLIWLVVWVICVVVWIPLADAIGVFAR